MSIRPYFAKMTYRMSPTCTTDGQMSHVTKVVCAILYWNMGAQWSKMMMFGAVT